MSCNGGLSDCEARKRLGGLISKLKPVADPQQYKFWGSQNARMIDYDFEMVALFYRPDLNVDR